jgi:hypothetical protein
VAVGLVVDGDGESVAVAVAVAVAAGVMAGVKVVVGPGGATVGGGGCDC